MCQLSSLVASMSGSCFKKICSIYCMASCLVLLEDTAVIVPEGGRSVEADVEISLSLTVAMSCRVGQLIRIVRMLQSTWDWGERV